MKTIEEKVEMLIKANERLTNQVKSLEERLDKVVKGVNSHLDDVYTKLNELEIGKEEKPMACGNSYIREIDLITSCTETEWKGSKWLNYELSLKGHNEVYSAFVRSTSVLEPDQAIQFIYDGGGKLKSLKIKNWN